MGELPCGSPANSSFASASAERAKCIGPTRGKPLIELTDAFCLLLLARWALMGPSANWNPRIDAVWKCLHSFRMRSLSYSGRAIVANALALSRIWYVASLVCMPSWVLKKLDSLVNNFFWVGKKDLVRRNAVVQKKDSNSKFKPFGAMGEGVPRIHTVGGSHY